MKDRVKAGHNLKPFEEMEFSVEHYLTYDIKENSEQLAAIYSRLTSNFPKDKDFKYWRTRFDYWVDYRQNIRNMGIDTLEKAHKEIDRTFAETRLMMDLESRLSALLKSSPQ